MTDVSEDSLPEWTAEELAVLRTADDDGPPARSLAATLAAVGAGSAVASGAVAAKGASVAASVGSSIAAPAKMTGALLVTKWLGIVSVGSVVITGSVVLLQRGGEAPGVRATANSGPEMRPVDLPHPVAAVVPAEPLPSTDGVPASPGVAVAGEPAAAPNAPGRVPGVRSQPDISLEIAALDEARSALRGGSPAAALGALDRYDAKFARGGSLRVEATALRIEALLRSGKREPATALASGFLARNPKSPYAARVRALIGPPRASQ